MRKSGGILAIGALLAVIAGQAGAQVFTIIPNLAIYSGDVGSSFSFSWYITASATENYDLKGFKVSFENAPGSENTFLYSYSNVKKELSTTTVDIDLSTFTVVGRTLTSTETDNPNNWNGQGGFRSNGTDGAVTAPASAITLGKGTSTTDTSSMPGHLLVTTPSVDAISGNFSFVVTSTSGLTNNNAYTVDITPIATTSNFHGTSPRKFLFTPVHITPEFSPVFSLAGLLVVGGVSLFARRRAKLLVGAN